MACSSSSELEGHSTLLSAKRQVVGGNEDIHNKNSNHNSHNSSNNNSKDNSSSNRNKCLYRIHMQV